MWPPSRAATSSNWAHVCPATVSFVDSTGATLSTQSVTLAPGASAFLAQPGGSASGVLAPRPVVTLTPPQPILPVSPFLPLRAVLAPNPCVGVVSMAEVFDAASAKTRVLLPPNPIRVFLGF